MRLKLEVVEEMFTVCR